MRLHGYWRSGAAWRVRIALALKGLEHEQVTHDLRLAEQRAPAFAALNPQQLVPALETGGPVLTQSLAILEWLEETYPSPPLLPSAAGDRALVRGMAMIVCCDIHPLGNLRVLNALREDFKASEDDVKGWITRWIGEGFHALETLVSQHGGAFAFGDEPTIADCCLVPQLYSAERFKVDLSPYPRLREVGARCAEHAAFVTAHPNSQPDTA